jgi:hypothetical protein
MSKMATQTGFTSAKGKGLTEFRLIPRIETFPAVVSFAQTPPGKVVVLAAFGVGMRFFLPDIVSVLWLMLPLALITFMPEHRRFILALVPIVLVVMQTLGDPLTLGLTLAVIASGVVLYLCAMRWPQSRFGQRPVASLLVGFIALILLACFTTSQSFASSVLWTLVGVVASYVWFIAYAVTDRNSKPGQELTLELAAFRPLWGSTNTPFPKGAAYLRRIEAKNPEQLAIFQLKGLKLLAWAILLALLQTQWSRFFHGYLRIPTTDQALAMSVHHMPPAWHLSWESVILAFFESIFEVSVFGHRIIACCRLAGFNALRNTYRPLSSTTIAEFFNRFYYYYKELVVEFFFFPTFFRYWKNRPRLRLVFATFSAAFFGNVFYHFTRDWTVIRDAGFLKALSNYQSFAFYCLALAAMLSISQLRKKATRPTGFLQGKIMPAFKVCFLFCLLNIFAVDTQLCPLVDRFRYLAGLFFIHF